MRSLTQTLILIPVLFCTAIASASACPQQTEPAKQEVPIKEIKNTIREQFSKDLNPVEKVVISETEANNWAAAASSLGATVLGTSVRYHYHQLKVDFKSQIQMRCRRVVSTVDICSNKLLAVKVSGCSFEEITLP